jgi:L-lactate dehydrogenase complex protein LldG
VPGISQDEFIRGVRDAIGTRRDASSPSDREIARVVAPADDIVERFCRLAVDAKMKLYRIAGESAVAETILGILKEAGAKSAVITDESLPQRDAIVATLRGAGCTLADLRDNDCTFQADVGITLARLGIAETGSIVIRSSSKTRRLASLAVPEHIAILRKTDIVPDLLDWAATLAVPMPANEVLITGPSRTADIELNLVMGVHGPKNVHVVLLQ